MYTIPHYYPKTIFNMSPERCSVPHTLLPLVNTIRLASRVMYSTPYLIPLRYIQYKSRAMFCTPYLITTRKHYSIWVQSYVLYTIPHYYPVTLFNMSPELCTVHHTSLLLVNTIQYESRVMYCTPYLITTHTIQYETRVNYLTSYLITTSKHYSI
jgi:hypothetical protein